MPSVIQTTAVPTICSRSGGPIRLDLTNKNTIGIGFITGGKAATQAQMDAGKGLTDFLSEKYGIPKSEIFGHGELQGHDKERAHLGPGGTPEGSQEAAGLRGAPTDVASPPGALYAAIQTIGSARV